jgi:hypothetical protein
MKLEYKACMDVPEIRQFTSSQLVDPPAFQRNFAPIRLVEGAQDM